MQGWIKLNKQNIIMLNIIQWLGCYIPGSKVWRQVLT